MNSNQAGSKYSSDSQSFSGRNPKQDRKNKKSAVCLQNVNKNFIFEEISGKNPAKYQGHKSHF